MRKTDVQIRYALLGIITDHATTGDGYPTSPLGDITEALLYKRCDHATSTRAYCSVCYHQLIHDYYLAIAGTPSADADALADACLADANRYSCLA